MRQPNGQSVINLVTTHGFKNKLCSWCSAYSFAIALYFSVEPHSSMLQVQLQSLQAYLLTVCFLLFRLIP
jgi:hypothetical protein